MKHLADTTDISAVFTGQVFRALFQRLCYAALREKPPAIVNNKRRLKVATVRPGRGT
jgi:hypothetical protein